ncbi:MAG: VOC family protein [Alphaproteobacteria bacterium]|nr:VOC family protein [Alphaproteobacteria bacterium]
MPDIPRFHLAFPVHDLQEARRFYGGILGCREGRSAPEWVDFDFFGHQIVAHLSTGGGGGEEVNVVDREKIPVRHFGVILTPALWQELRDRFRSANVTFLVEPQTRFKGQAGEQSTLFVRDPSGNALEFKAFSHDAMVFARGDSIAR